VNRCQGLDPIGEVRVEDWRRGSYGLKRLTGVFSGEGVHMAVRAD